MDRVHVRKLPPIASDDNAGITNKPGQLPHVPHRERVPEFWMRVQANDRAHAKQVAAAVDLDRTQLPDADAVLATLDVTDDVARIEGWPASLVEG